MFAIFIMFAQLTTVQIDAVKASYKALDSQAVESKVATAQPPKDAEKIDVSPRLRSASFGHTTTLLVAHDGKSYWVEYGRSTNRPGGTYGPFAVDAKAKPAPAPAPTPAPAK
jgi:hypothetical protein